RIRASDGRALGTFAVGTRPMGIAFAASSVWVANNLDNTVTRLRAVDGTLLGTYPVGDGPFGVTFDGTSVWVTSYFANTVTRFIAASGTRLGTMTVGESPGSILAERDRLLIANNAGDSVTILRRQGPSERDGAYQRPASALVTVPAPGGPFGLAVTRDESGSRLWVASFSGDA